MTTSAFDSVRPPEQPGRGRRKGQRQGPPRGRRGQSGGGDGSREMAMVPEPEFSSYYGRPVVKAPPWGHDIAAYLFLGGLAGGSALLGGGAQATGRDILARNCRLTAITAVSVGAVALVRDLGRPERFINMLRVLKLTSPMSVGSWLLTAFSTGAGVAAAAEADKLTGGRAPLGPLRPVLRAAAGPAGTGAAALGAPLAVYTAVLLADTAVPTWNEARDGLPLVFASSAAMASAGVAMVTTPAAQAGPARRLAVLGAAGDLAATKMMERRMDPVAAEPLHHGRPGRMMRLSEALAVAGGLAALLGGRHRAVATASGLCLAAASALTRTAVFEAGLHSAADPRYTIEPQKRRLAARRAAGITGDSITTAG